MTITNDKTDGLKPGPEATPGRTSKRFAVRAPQTAHDIERLLRRRLMIVALLAALASAFFCAFRYSTPEQWDYFRSIPSGSWLLVYEASFFVTSLVLAIVLARRRQWTLGAMRVVEYALVTLFAVYVGWTQLIAWSGVRITPMASGEYDPFVMRQFVDSMAVRWLALIVGMATLIPETWQRSAAMVALLATTAMALTAWMAFNDPVYSRLPGKTLFLMGFWMVIASTIAIFGSYKLSELREQVRQALELGQYRLKQKLGAGGMGEVYLAEHVMLKQDCAIKFIRPERAGDPSALRRFEREVKAMSQLKHWNTVQVFDYGHTDDGTFYYVMEYLPGQTLEEMVKREGPLSPARVVHFMRQMCAALNEAHAMGLIHRDIKPANIITGTRGGVSDVAKLLDFGLARHTDERREADGLTQDGAVLGTPAYMSPEQIDGGAALDGRTDIYSLGGVGYFLLTGRSPYPRERPMEMMIAHARDPLVQPSELRDGIPANLEAIIVRCLAKRPEERFASVTELEAALAACAA